MPLPERLLAPFPRVQASSSGLLVKWGSRSVLTAPMWPLHGGLGSLGHPGPLCSDLGLVSGRLWCPALWLSPAPSAGLMWGWGQETKPPAELLGTEGPQLGSGVAADFKENLLSSLHAHHRLFSTSAISTTLKQLGRISSQAAATPSPAPPCVSPCPAAAVPQCPAPPGSLLLEAGSGCTSGGSEGRWAVPGEPGDPRSGLVGAGDTVRTPASCPAQARCWVPIRSPEPACFPLPPPISCPPQSSGPSCSEEEDYEIHALSC